MKKSSERLLDAISSLKRAAHIENLRDMPDHFNKGNCLVFAGSQESADLLQDILGQALASPHPGAGLKIETETSEDWGIFGLAFPASENTCQTLAERIESYTGKLVAPDHVKRSR
jgi:hypothetical protein